jgi:hypothetical protein
MGRILGTILVGAGVAVTWTGFGTFPGIVIAGAGVNMIREAEKEKIDSIIASMEGKESSED